MYRRPFRVIVWKENGFDAYHARSTFTTLHGAVDRAWQWVDKGYNVDIVYTPTNTTVWTSVLIKTQGDGHIIPF